MTKIQAPKNCPCCSSVLEIVNNLLFCRNTSCLTKTHKKMEHFAKTLKIKGLGPKAIEKLGVSTSQELYLLTKDEITHLLDSEKLASKLYAEIVKSKNVPMNVLLPALSIPLIGNSAAKKLAEVCASIFDVTSETCEASGLGPKSCSNLLSYLDENIEYLTSLPFSLNFDKPKTNSVSLGTVCISGKLSSFKTKAEAEKTLQSLGYATKSSLTKDVTILVNESGIESAKTKKARTSGIQIINNLKQFIGE